MCLYIFLQASETDQMLFLIIIIYLLKNVYILQNKVHLHAKKNNQIDGFWIKINTKIEKFDFLVCL